MTERSSNSSQRVARLKLWLLMALGVALISAAAVYFGRRPRLEPSPSSSPTSGAVRSAPTNIVTTTRSHDDFLGAEACASCHAPQYEQWKKSTHGQAGAPIDQARLLARFDGKPLRFSDAVVTPTTNATGRPIFIVEQTGGNRIEVEVDAAVGGGHMLGGGTQTFFNKFPDGTVRFLPFDFIRDENVWFVQLRRDNTWAPVSSEISLQKDLANWPPHRVLGTIVDFSNCQNCHGSQITIEYQPQLSRYETRYTSLAINCESCHGPGRRHAQLMAQSNHNQEADIGMAPLATLSKDESIKVCLQCHANKVALRDEPYLPGDDLDAFFSVKLSHFWHSPFLPDGRVRGFGYQGNHLYSDCYLDGSMTCTDCHDPHSQHYRNQLGVPLAGKFDNGQCTGCHASKGLDSAKHSHHTAGSDGDRCTSCHMPYLQHQGVGQLLKFARSDHTIPIPRPGFDEQLGIQNACDKCHADRGLDWQLTKSRQWYGELKPHPQMVANILETAESPDLPTAARLLIVPEANHPMAQTGGLSYFIQRYLHPAANLAEAGLKEKLLTLATNQDLDIKALALVALQLGWDADASVRAAVDSAKKHLGDSVDPLRNRWALTADQWGTILGQREDAEGALRCFQAALEIQPKNVVSLSNLALTYLRLGDGEKCVATLQEAIKIRPYQAALHFQLGQALAQLSRFAEARKALEEGLRYAPNDPTARRLLQLLP